MSRELLVDVLKELIEGQIKAESRIANISSIPTRSQIPYLSDLLTLCPTEERLFQSSVEVLWINSSNLTECLEVLSSVKALGVTYLAFDHNSRVNNDPFLSEIRYITFAISVNKAYAVDLRMLSITSFAPILSSKTLKLVYDSLPFLAHLKHLDIVLNQIGDLRILDILLLRGLGDLKPNLCDSIKRYLGKEVIFPKQTQSLSQDDWVQILSTQSAYLFALAEKMYPEIRKEGLGKVAKLEMQALKSLCDIQYNGMPFSVERVQEFSNDYQLELGSVSEQLHNHLDYMVESPEGPLSCEVNLASPQQLLRSLRRIGLKLPNTKDSVLSLYKSEHEVISLLIKYRNLSYMVQHIGESYLRYLHPVTQRIHPRVNPIGTRTSRIIITEPNTQGIKHGVNRKLFKAPTGTVFVMGDYKQIEVFIYAVLSNDEKLLEDCADEDGVYIVIARMFLNRELISPEDRNRIKPVVIGLLYDMTDYGISSYSKGFGVDVTLSEASAWRRLFFKRYEGVERYQKKLARKVCAERYVESILGRKRRFDTRRVIAGRPGVLSVHDFKSLIGSVAYSSTIDKEGVAIYTVDTGHEAEQLQEQLQELNLETKTEQSDPPLSMVFNGVAQMSCADLIKTAASLIYPELNTNCQIVNTAHDDLAFVVNETESLVFAEKLKDVMIRASYELFKPHKARVSIKIGGDYDL